MSGGLERLAADPRVESIDDGRASGDPLFVNLARGWAWSGQRSFGVANLAEARRLLAEARPDLDSILYRLSEPARLEVLGLAVADLEAAGCRLDRIAAGDLEAGRLEALAVPGGLADALGSRDLGILADALGREIRAYGESAYHNGRTWAASGNLADALDSYADPDGPERLESAILERLGRIAGELRAAARRRSPAALEALEARGLAAWAAYLVNGDESGLEAGDKAQADRFAAYLGGAIVDCEADGFGRPEYPPEALAGELATYRALVPVALEAGQ